MNFGEYLSNYLKAHGMSYRTFGQKCGLSAGYISMLINKRNPKTGRSPTPTLNTYYNIAKAMGISLDTLFNEIDNAPVSMQADSFPSFPDNNYEIADCFNMIKQSAESGALTLDGVPMTESEAMTLLDGIETALEIIRRRRAREK